MNEETNTETVVDTVDETVEDVIEEVIEANTQVEDVVEVEEPVVDEEVVEEVKEDTTQFDELNEQVTQLSSQVEELTQSLSLKDEEVKSLGAYKTAVEELLESKKEIVQEEYAALLPNGDALQQLLWLNKAEEAGLFKKKENPAIEIGTFTDVVAEDKTKNQYENLTARELLALGAKGLFSK